MHTGNPREEDVHDGALRVIAVMIHSARPLILYPLVIAILAVAISFLFPNYYRSTVLILPPERSFQSMELGLGELASFAAGGMALPLMATPSDILEAVIMSRTVRDSTIVHLNLTERWGKSYEEVGAYLARETGSKVHNSGIVEAWAIVPERHFADTLVNTIAEEADNLNRGIVNTKARRTREFVEQRLAETKGELDSAASALERFQNEHRTVALETQIAALVKNAADLKAQMTADEIELSVLETSLSAEHPRVRLLRSRILETQKRLDELMTSPAGNVAGDGRPSFGLEGLPKLVQQLAEITRDLKVAEGVYALLTQQYENARIQERRDTPSFSILDRAANGGAKARPKRALIGLSTLVVSFVLMLAFVLSREYYDRLAETDPERRRAWESVLRSLKLGHSRRTSANG